jgi:hypothetical protein
MKTMSVPAIDETEPRIGGLKKELARMRFAVLALIPEDLGDLLGSFMSCQSRRDVQRWREDLIAELLERAQAAAAEDARCENGHVCCPLCDRENSRAVGRRFPDGLRRHLQGSRRRLGCVVMDAAFGLLEEWLERPNPLAKLFGPEVLAKRRPKELRYRLAPGGEPLLYDEQMLWDWPRTPEERLWAEERLQVLGFRCAVEGRTRAWLDETDDYVVYADPRMVGSLSFKVWRKPLPSHPTIGPYFTCETGQFELRDVCKRNLPGLYAERLARALAADG